MEKINRKLVGLIGLGALVVAVGIGLSRDAAAGDVTWVPSAVITAIQTDAHGVITTISYRSSNAEHNVNGCGAKLTDLPHVMEQYRTQRLVDLGIESGCMKFLTARR